MSENDLERIPMLVLNIELGTSTLNPQLIGGNKQEIRVFQNDTPKQIAKNFCERNNLDSRIESKIVNYIERNIPTLYTASPKKPSLIQGKPPGPCMKKSHTRNQQGETESLKECVENYAEKILTGGKRRQAGEFIAKQEFNTTYSFRSEKTFTELSYKSTPCSAVYPKKRPVSAWTKDGPKKTQNPYGDPAGISLYRKGFEAAKERTTSLLKAKQDKEVEELKKFSFTPRINHSNTFNSLKPPEDILLEKHEEQKQRLAKKKSDRELQIKKECPFKPTISKKSDAMAKKARSVKCRSEVHSEKSVDELLNNTDIFHSLYTMSKLPTTKSLAISTNCTFHPKIAKWNYNTPKARVYVAKPVEERLISSKAEAEEKLKRTREKKEFQEAHFDPKTGQKLHAPKVSRGPKVSTHDPKRPLHENLYRDRYLEAKKTEALQKDKKRWQELHSKKTDIGNSLQVLESSRRKKMQDVFRLLDPDTCGTISRKHVKLDCLSSETLDFLSPILLKIESEDLTLKMKDFVKLSEPYSAKLTPAQLRELTVDPKKKLKEELRKTFSFAPKLSDASSKYASKKRVQTRNTNELSQRLYTDYAKREKDRKRELEKCKQKEIAPCTFAPKVHEYEESIFNKTPADNEVRKYVANRSLSKEKAKKKEQELKKRIMKL